MRARPLGGGANRRARTPHPLPPTALKEAAMDSAVTAWLIAELGTDTSIDDLTARYTRLGTARAVALEVLRERLAAMRTQPTSVTVTNVVAVNFTANLASYERQIALLESGGHPAPDETPTSSDPTLGYLQLVPRRRR